MDLLDQQVVAILSISRLRLGFQCLSEQLASEQMEKSLAQNHKIGEFKFKSPLAKKDISLILQLANKLQPKDSLIPSIWIQTQDQSDWKQLFSFILYVGCKVITFSTLRKYFKESISDVKHLLEFPHYIERIPFPTLQFLWFQGVNVTSFQPLTNIEAPNLRQINIEKSPYVNIKSVNKTNFERLESIRIETLVVTGLLYSSRSVRNNESRGVKLVIRRKFEQRDRQLESKCEVLSYDLSFLVKLSPYALLFAAPLSRLRNSARIISNLSLEADDFYDNEYRFWLQHFCHVLKGI